MNVEVSDRLRHRTSNIEYRIKKSTSLSYFSCIFEGGRVKEGG